MENEIRDLSFLIESALRNNKKVELVLTNDVQEGECLAVRIENKEYFLAWETFEGIEPLEEYLIKKPKRYASKKLLNKAFGNWSREQLAEEIERSWEDHQLAGERLIELQEELGKRKEK